MLTIFIVVAYGVLPFVSVLHIPGGGILRLGFRTLPLNGSISMLFGPDGSAPFLLVLVSLFLCVFSLASAIWAFTGQSEGRVATLIFLTLNVLWWSALVLVTVSENGLDPELLFIVPVEMLIPVGWLTFVWWNFLRPDVTEYYRYRSSLEDE